MMDWFKANAEMWGPPASIVVIGILLGWGFKRFIHVHLKKAAEKSKWKGYYAILDAI